jgi:hypothetical protein
LDKSGKAEGVIIGVGGFLGMGQHDIKVDLAHYWPASKIVRTDQRDYRFRTTLPRETVAKRIAEAVAGIDYTKVKSSASADRELAYFGVWSIIMGLQD